MSKFNTNAQSKSFFIDNVLPVLSAICLALPFLFYNSGWLSLVCVVPFLYWLELQHTKLMQKNFILSVWAIGVIFSFVVLGWMLSTRPDSWAYIPSWQGAIALTIVYVLMVLFISVQFIVFALLYRRLEPDLLSPKSLIVLPAMWVTSEIVRSVAFSLLSYGPGGSIGPHWNFGILGLAGSVTSLGFGARIVGLYGLSFIFVLINICVFWMLHRIYKVPILVVVGALFVCFFGYAVYAIPTGRAVSVGLVQLQSRADLNNANQDFTLQFKNDLSTTQLGSVDILVLPEYSDFYRDENKVAATSITQQYMNASGGVITSEDNHVSGHGTNDLKVYTADGSVRSTFAKQFLMPLGEYMPYVISSLLRLFGKSEALEIANTSQVIDQGKAQILPVQIAGAQVGSLACSGIIAPEFYRVLARNGAGILTNSAALGIFTNAPLYHAQSKQMARFHAIANARPFVQAAEGAYSYDIDSNGNFLYATPSIGQYYHHELMMTNSTRTIYTLLGEWVAYLSIVLVGVLIVFSYHKR